MPNMSRFEHPQLMEVHVDGPAGANRMYIFAGTAVLSWRCTDDDSWTREPMVISMASFPGRPVIQPDRWIDAVAVASPAAFRSVETMSRDDVGFAVDSARPYPPSGDFPEDYGVTTELAIRGRDARLYRVSFQLTVLARM